MTEPAFFVHDPTSGLFIPANKQATAQAAVLSKMKLNRGDLVCLKHKRIPVKYPSGEEIDLSVSA